MQPSEITVAKVLDLLKRKLSAPWSDGFASEPHNTSNLLKHKVAPRLLWSPKRIAAHVIMSSGDDADSWMYLFSDLSCVVIFYKACLVILECGTSGSNMAVVGLMFWIIFATRLYFDDYSNRFTAKFNRIMCFIYSIGMFLMALNTSAFKLSSAGQSADFESELVTCSDSRNEYFVGFAYGFLITRGVLITIYTRLMYLDINCFRQFRLDLFRFCCAFVMVSIGCIANGLRDVPFSAEQKILFFLITTVIEWGLLVVDMWIMASVRDTISLCPCLSAGRSSAFSPHSGDSSSGDIMNVLTDNRLVTVDNTGRRIGVGTAAAGSAEHPVAALEMEESVPISTSSSCQMVFNYFYPLDIYRHQSRLGLFIMMILGEVVLELGLPPYSNAAATDVSDFAFFTLVLSFSFGIQYYDCVHRLPGSPHAMQRSALSAFVFTWLHPAIGYCMLLVTVASSSYYAEVHHVNGEVSTHWRQVLSYACASVVFSLTFTRLLHKGLAHGTLSPLYQCRIVFIVAHVLVQYAEWDYRWDVVVHSLLALLLACIDLLGYKIKQDLGVISPQSMHMKNLLLGLTDDHPRRTSVGRVTLESGSGALCIEEGRDDEESSSLRHSLSLSDSLYARRSVGASGADHHTTLSASPVGGYTQPQRSLSPPKSHSGV